MKESDRFQKSSEEGHAGLHKIANERSNVMYFYTTCSIKGTLANNVDPDQTPQNAASDQGLHCLH